MPSAVASAPRAASARLRGMAAPPPPPTAKKRTRPPTADSSTPAGSPLRSRTSDVVVVAEGLQRSPVKRSRTAAETPTAPSTPPGRDTAAATTPTPTNATNTHATRPAITPHTRNVPEDVAKICGIASGHADALATALAIVYEADPLTGSAVDTVLQKLFYTVTSQALRAATTPPPATMAAPATATRPPPTYASKLAPQTTPLSPQTTPLSQQTNSSYSNARTTATKPPPYEEVILHTSRMTSPPSCETIVNTIKSTAGDRVPAYAVRRLPSGDSAVIFPRGTDRWYVKDVSWAEDLGADVTITGPRVVLHGVPAATLLDGAQNLHNRLNTPCPVLQTRPMIRKDGPPARFGSLCLTVATDADAALLIRDGVILDYHLYRAVPYRPDTRPQICHRCQTWDHKARVCRKPPRCAHCGGAHESPSCDKPSGERQCPNCRGPHPAYSHTCPFYQNYLTEYRNASGTGRRPPPARPDISTATHTPQLPPMSF
jgi:hypothetical protein